MHLQIQTKNLGGNAGTGNEGEAAILAALADHTKKFETALQAKSLEIGEIQQRANDLETELAGLKSRGGFESAAPAIAAPVADFIKSPQLKAMMDGANGTGRVALKCGSLKLLTKAISNAGAGQAGDNGYNVQPDRWLGLGNNPQRALSLLDVLPAIPVATGSFEYMQLDGYTNAAAVQVKEGDAKAAASMPTTITTANISTIAHYMRASVQVLGDAPALSAQVNNLLGYGCQAKLESELVNGAGGTGKIKGLLSFATPYSATAALAADKIGEAITELQSNGWHPSVIVLNPADWFAIQSARGTSNDGYLLGSPRNPAPPSLWGVPVITTASLAVGTALVLDASQCALLERQEVTVMASREDASNFTTNMVTVLAELRAGLAVFSPGAVLSVALAATT